ncbi:MAG: 3-isopropylmalate dehydratase small subunit [Planctomycetaceae bacterium]|nr:3-isopropylmalate dehydratase small subunit [Planctomycetaceae bacterium]
MQTIESITARAIPLPLDDIDTDRIIPARYLRCVTFEGLGEHAFEDDRQQNAEHPFNQPQFQGAGILLAGRNFGCGSSREHAPQSLMRWGVKAIVGESFAEIFFGNCTANGIPCVCADPEALRQLGAAVTAAPKTELTVNLVNKTVTCGTRSFPISMQEGARQSLVTGNWDFLGQLVEVASQTREVAQRLPYMNSFA